MQNILVYMALTSWRSCNEVGLVNQMFHTSGGFLIDISLDIRMLLCRAKNRAEKKKENKGNKDRKWIIHSTTTTIIIIVSKWEKMYLKKVNFNTGPSVLPPGHPGGSHRAGCSVVISRSLSWNCMQWYCCVITYGQ